MKLAFKIDSSAVDTAIVGIFYGEIHSLVVDRSIEERSRFRIRAVVQFGIGNMCPRCSPFDSMNPLV